MRPDSAEEISDTVCGWRFYLASSSGHPGVGMVVSRPLSDETRSFFPESDHKWSGNLAMAKKYRASH